MCSQLPRPHLHLASRAAAKHFAPSSASGIPFGPCNTQGGIGGGEDHYDLGIVWVVTEVDLHLASLLGFTRLCAGLIHPTISQV